MKSIAKLSLLFLMVSLCLVSCRKDSDNNGPVITIPVEPPSINVQASLFGLVKDDQGEGIEDASVEIDGELIGSTDENGAFKTGQMQMNQYGSNVTVSKDGYFLGSTFVQPKNGQTVYTELQLVTKSLRGSFDSSQGGSINANGNSSIDFTASSIADASGNAYSGNVNVYAHWYDPSADNLNATMPGDLRAVNSDQAFQQLGTYGMMAVELEDNNGNELNILDGKEANINFPVPAEILGGAPSSIPLWHFDETSGYWLEDGSAPLVDGTYMATVSHFSFWNCDIPENFIELSGALSDVNGNMLNGVTLKFTDQNASYGFAYIQSDGSFSLKVPKENELTMEVIDYCGNVVYTETVGPFSVDTTLPTTTVGIAGSGIIQVSGQLTKCDGNAYNEWIPKSDRRQWIYFSCS